MLNRDRDCTPEGKQRTVLDVVGDVVRASVRIIRCNVHILLSTCQ
jgi:hypothetical protein